MKYTTANSQNNSIHFEKFVSLEANSLGSLIFLSFQKASELVYTYIL